MRLVIQRVREASVTVDGNITGQIGPGLLVLVGCAPTDDESALNWMVRKLTNLRIFSDENDQMNRSVRDTGGQVLVVSQFTLLADTRKGNRPSYIGAAPPGVAEPLYERFVALVAQELGQSVPTGIFGADMQVRLLNDGPVTIVLDSPANS